MDPYRELGIARGASEAEIRSAYRSLAARHHPDTGGNAQKFRRILNAYEQIQQQNSPAETPPPAATAAPPKDSPKPVGPKPVGNPNWYVSSDRSWNPVRYDVPGRRPLPVRLLATIWLVLIAAVVVWFILRQLV